MSVKKRAMDLSVLCIISWVAVIGLLTAQSDIHEEPENYILILGLVESQQNRSDDGRVLIIIDDGRETWEIYSDCDAGLSNGDLVWATCVSDSSQQLIAISFELV